MRWREVIDKCVDERSCEEALREFFDAMSARAELEELPQSARRAERFAWVERLIERGVRDGRQRLILYVISRYLVSVKGMGVEEAVAEVEKFIDNSCRNYGNCGKIYSRWVRHVVEKVAEKRWPPWSLEKLRERDADLYRLVEEALGGPAGI
ncbi:MAG: DNA primase noncatalytic subunit PriX [Acidilobaceae archaeon]|nr:DNA primase noncatalytic subunit PriX [Acidilobaceae archaeon]